MPLVPVDPVRGVMNLAHVKGCGRGDVLVQSLAVCIGFWFLDEDAVDDFSGMPVTQAAFEKMVCAPLEGIDPQAAESFRQFSQVRLGDRAFQEILSYWASSGMDRERLLRRIKRLVYPNLARIYWPSLVVPEWLENFAISLLPDVGGTFYDGASGTGSTARKAAERSRKSERPLKVVASEANPMLFHLSVLLAKIHGFDFQQTHEDCLSADCRSLPKADLSVMFPPLRGGEPVCLSESVTCGGDWAYAYHQLCMLGGGGTGVCRIPNGALFNAKNRPFREYLLKLNVIDAIIALPKNSVPLSPSAPATSLVVFRKGRKETAAVQMAELPAERPAEDGKGCPVPIRYDILRSPLAVMEENSRRVPLSELDAFNLSPHQYLSCPQRSGGQPVSPGAALENRSAVRLQEVARIYRGLNVAHLSRSDEGAQVLRLSDVQDGRILMDGLTRYDLPERTDPERYRIHKGDILISCKGKAIKLCLVSETDPPLLSHDFLGIRPDPGRIDPQYLFYFLQSPAGQRAVQLTQMGSSIPMIRAADLERLPLRYIPLAAQTQCAAELHAVNAVIEKQLAALRESKERAYEQFYKKIGLEDML